ncbi:hypothetical protein KTC96_14270 [Clostridium estertheticum]|uniref:hypothetical protein n=1 Tax=Clostridium estertheticum TaxID=238834 RepID=UPI001C7DC7A8|nr:hypothetical protein [Clostridium estertheticum]MBX4258839.1 hypothetical protein [Clostridium estertheticum]WLC69155.1 hypothetical protein KTC96_14270 [Clostridium estertheticum]
MDTALYKNELDEEIINAYEINGKEYQEIYKGKLFCTEHDCNAILVHNDKQKGGVSKYFSTKPHSSHKDGCTNEVIHNGTRASIRKAGTIGVNINDAHKKRVLDEAYKIFSEVLNPTTDNRLTQKTKKKKSTTLKTDDAISRSSDVGGVPIVDGSGQDIDGIRPPYVYKREVSELTNDDVGTTKEVHGIVEGIRIRSDKVYIDLIGIKKEKISLHIGNPFKINYEQEFKYLYFLKSIFYKNCLKDVE